ncbi:WD40 repeat domain-containing protein [Sulfurimonas sp.]|nr:WD40 repeat domain-containing protein [Sulfurimonas sp.]
MSNVNTIKVYIIFFLFLIIGLQNLHSKQVENIAYAFDNAEEISETYSSWFNRNEKLPLTIIATAYIDNQAIKTEEYKKYKQLIQKISKDKTLLDRLSNSDISSKYSTIKYIDYKKSSLHINKFNAAYTNRHSSKDKLSDILKPETELPSQELTIGLNYKELKKGNLTIEGYKTVKEKSKNRNSYYYTLRKTGYKDLSKKDKNEALVNSILLALQLDIPEYVSIDRKSFIKKNETIKFARINSDNSHKIEVWKHEVDSSIENKIREAEKLKASSKVLRGHNDWINAVDISKNGKYAISGAGDNTIRYWNLKTGKTIKTLKGHNKYITAVKISPDSKYAISGSKDNTLIYWDLKSGKKISTLTGHTKLIKSVCFDSTGRYVLSASKDKTLRYWDLKTSSSIMELKGHKKSVYLGKITADGKHAYSASKDKTILYWDLITGDKLNISNDRKEHIYDIHSSKKGNYALSGNQDYILNYWDLDSGNVLKVLKGHKKRIDTASISPDRTYALSGGAEKSLRYWDLTTGNTLAIKGHSNSIYDISISLDSKHVISGSEDTTLRYWDINQFNKSVKEMFMQVQNTKESRKYRDDENRQLLLTSTLSQKDISLMCHYKYINIDRINLKNLKQIERALNYSYLDPIICSKFQQIYNKHLDANIHVSDNITYIDKREIGSNELYFSSELDLKKAGYRNLYSYINKVEELPIIDKRYEGVYVKSIALSPDGKNILSGTGDYKSIGNENVLKYTNLHTGKLHKLLIEHENSINSVAISPNGKYALSGSGNYLDPEHNRDPLLKYWDLKTGKLIKVLNGHQRGVTAVSFTPDNRYALSASYDKMIKQWDLKSGKLIKTLKGHVAQIRTMQISPDGKHILSAGGGAIGSDLGIDYRLFFWNLKNGKLLRTLKGHTTEVNSVAISPDGKHAISGSGNILGGGELFYWDLKSGEKLKELKGHTGQINSVAISKNGRYAVSASGNISKDRSIYGILDNTIRLWDLKTGKNIKILRGHNKPVNVVLITKDGKHAISSSSDFSIKKWNIEMLKSSDF